MNLDLAAVLRDAELDPPSAPPRGRVLPAARPSALVVMSEGRWVPACGGTEVPFRTRTGRTLLYCWNPVTGVHAYLDVDSDLVLSDEDARLALAV